MMVTCIEAKECRAISIDDVRGSFLIPNMPDFTIVWFIDEQVDTICAANPSCKKCASHEG